MDFGLWSPELAREETVVVALRRFSRSREFTLREICSGRALALQGYKQSWCFAATKKIVVSPACRQAGSLL